MIEWLCDRRGEVILIPLDHDLPIRQIEGQTIDSGTGRQVADYLATCDPTCPVIVHSSNNYFSPVMMFVLEDAGWPCRRVYPSDDLDWITSDWAEQARRLLTMQCPNLRDLPT